MLLQPFVSHDMLCHSHYPPLPLFSVSIHPSYNYIKNVERAIFSLLPINSKDAASSGRGLVVAVCVAVCSNMMCLGNHQQMVEKHGRDQLTVGTERGSCFHAVDGGY